MTISPFRSLSTTPLAFALVALAFLGSSLYVHWHLAQIDADTEAILGNALPGIEHLSAAMSVVRVIEASCRDMPDVAPERRAAAREDVERAFRQVDAEIAEYLALPKFPGEREAYDELVPAALRRYDRALDHLFRQVASGDVAGAHQTVDGELRTATTQANNPMRRLVMMDAAGARQAAARIQETRRQAARVAAILDGAALLLAMAATAWVLSVFRSHARLTAAHGALQEQRAFEMEQFGRRVAHDLLSPLAALTYALHAFKRPSEADPKLAEALRRAKGCVTRTQDLVDGIFEFSRAGGRPEAGARVDVGEVVHQVVDEILASDPRDRPEIQIDAFDPCEVACSRGVLASLVGNLVRNADKFMVDRTAPRIRVGASRVGGMIRVEVEDSGPGIPQGLEQAIFEPYFRAQGVTQAGLGLGLATVKRLCEAHGGRVGASQAPRNGAIVWFTMPAAEGDESRADAEPASRRAG